MSLYCSRGPIEYSVLREGSTEPEIIKANNDKELVELLNRELAEKEKKEESTITRG